VKADILMARGLRLLNTGQADAALAIAEALYAIRYSGAFDIHAQALDQLGRKSDAIILLRQSLTVAPDAWVNANLLAGYLCDEGKFEDAFSVYEGALDMPGVDRAVVEISYALDLDRAGWSEEARSRVKAWLAHDAVAVRPGLRRAVDKLARDLGLEAPT